MEKLRLRPASSTSVLVVVLGTAVLLTGGMVFGDVVPPDWESDYQGTAVQFWGGSGSNRADIGFNFDFYGESYSRASLSPNGYVQLGRGGPWNKNYSADSWPTGGWAKRIVSPIWTNFNPERSSSVDTWHRTLGEKGDRRFVVTWQKTPDTNGGKNTFQLQLHEAGNRMQMSYLSLPVDPPDPSDHPTPVGVNYGDGVRHASFNYNPDAGDSLEGQTVWLDYDSQSNEYDMSTEHVPEPGTLVLLLGGLGVGEIMRRRSD